MKNRFRSFLYHLIFLGLPLLLPCSTQAQYWIRDTDFAPVFEKLAWSQLYAVPNSGDFLVWPTMVKIQADGSVDPSFVFKGLPNTPSVFEPLARSSDGGYFFLTTTDMIWRCDKTGQTQTALSFDQDFRFIDFRDHCLPLADNGALVMLSTISGEYLILRFDGLGALVSRYPELTPPGMRLASADPRVLTDGSIFLRLSLVDKITSEAKIQYALVSASGIAQPDFAKEFRESMGTLNILSVASRDADSFFIALGSTNAPGRVALLRKDGTASSLFNIPVAANVSVALDSTKDGGVSVLRSTAQSVWIVNELQHFDANGVAGSAITMPPTSYPVTDHIKFLRDGSIALVTWNYAGGKRPSMKLLDPRDSIMSTPMTVLILDSEGNVTRNLADELGTNIDVGMFSGSGNGGIAISYGPSYYEPGYVSMAGTRYAHYQSASTQRIESKSAFLSGIKGAIINLPEVKSWTALSSLTVNTNEVGADKEGRIFLTAADRINSQDCKQVARLLKNGTLDTSFDPELPLGFSLDRSKPIHRIFDDGSLAIAGRAAIRVDENGFYRMGNVLLKLKPTGKQEWMLINSFAQTLGLNSAGRVLASYHTADSPSDIHLGWCLSNGSIEQVLPVVLGHDSYSSLSIKFLEGDKIAITGNFDRVNGNPSVGLIILQSDGSLDMGFAADLSFLSHPPTTPPSIDACSIDKQGRLYARIVLNNYPIDADHKEYQVRFLPSGKLDTTFPVVPLSTTYSGATQDDGLPNWAFAASVAQTGFNEQAAMVTTPDGKAICLEPFSLWKRNPVPMLGVHLSKGNADLDSAVVFQAVDSLQDIEAYQWYHDGKALAGETNKVMVMSGLKKSSAGGYELQVRRKDGSELHASATLAVLTSQLSGYSSRGVVTPDISMITGLILDRPVAGKFIVRSLGRALTGLVTEDLLGDNGLAGYQQVDSSSGRWSQIGQDSGGITSPSISALGASIGLLPVTTKGFPDGTNMGSALNLNIGSGAYTFVSSSEKKSTGVALTEMYLVDPTGTTPGTIKACSTRGRVGTGGNVLIAGFAIGGTGAVKLLFRGIGPSMTTSGVKNVITDPQIELHGLAEVLKNDDWQGDAAVAKAMKSLGMADWDPASKESAMVVVLKPGAYTLLLSDKNGQTGDGLVEAYIVEE